MKMTEYTERIKRPEDEEVIPGAQAEPTSTPALRHTRVNDIWLGPLERPAIAWLVRRLPLWVSPDMLTGVGLFGAAMVFAGYALSGHSREFLWLASAGFAVSWFGDSLDGSLARYRRIERPLYGFFLDHATDAIAEALVFIGLGISPFISLVPALFCLVAYLMLSVLVLVATCSRGEFRISYGGFGPTELRVFAVVLNVCFYTAPHPSISLPWLGQVSVYDAAAATLSAALLGSFLVAARGHERALAKIDPRPSPRSE